MKDLRDLKDLTIHDATPHGFTILPLILAERPNRPLPDSGFSPATGRIRPVVSTFKVNLKSEIGRSGLSVEVGGGTILSDTMHSSISPHRIVCVFFLVVMVRIS